MGDWGKWFQDVAGGAAQMYSQYKWGSNATQQTIVQQPATSPASPSQPIVYVEGQAGQTGGLVISSSMLLVVGAAALAYVLAKN